MPPSCDATGRLPFPCPPQFSCYTRPQFSRNLDCDRPKPGKTVRVTAQADHAGRASNYD